MDRITFLAVLRAVKNEAAKWGYHGDVLAAADDVPLVGTLRQQLVIATIGADVRPRPMNESERRLLSRFVRAVVLTSAPSVVTEVVGRHVNVPDAIARSDRHAIARRRQQRRADG